MSIFSGFLRLCWIPLLTWAVSIPCAEVAFRLAGTKVAGVVSGINEPFADGSYKMRPNASVYQNWLSGSFTIRTDEFGFRRGEADHPKDSVAGQTDILVLGDSQALGQGLEYEESVVGVFAGLAREERIVVRNAAIGGHFLRNQAEICRWLVKERGVVPRVVLVCLTPRSIANALAYNRVHVHEGGLFGGPPGRIELLKARLNARSALWVRVRDAVAAVRGTKESNSDSFLEMYRTGETERRFESELLSAIQSIRDSMLPSNPTLVLCYFPPDIESRVEAIARSTSREGIEAGVPLRVARSVARNMGIALLDVTPAIEATRAAGESVTLDGDAHYGADCSRRCGAVLWNGADWPGLVRGRQQSAPGDR